MTEFRTPRGLPIVNPAGQGELREGPTDRGSAPPTPSAPRTGPYSGSSRDLTDADLHGVLVAFYAAVEEEPLLAPYFAVVDMHAHMPRIVDFWSTLLFHTGRYSGNAFRPHLEMQGLTGEHFARWLAVLEATVDACFRGPVAERMKGMGHRIAYSMQLRLDITPFEAYRPDPG